MGWSRDSEQFKEVVAAAGVTALPYLLSMTWVDTWRDVMGEEPTDRTSREVSVQDVLAD